MLLTLLLTLVTCSTQAALLDHAHQAPTQEGRALPDAAAALAEVVASIRRADYRGDLAELARGDGALALHERDARFAAPVAYWRGFALWRLALNRMNEPGYDAALVRRELLSAVERFQSVEGEALRADARSAAAGSLMTVLYLTPPSDPEFQALPARIRQLLDAALAASPENPRVLWVLGGKHLFTPPEFGGSRALALETYERGLAACREESDLPATPLDPAWGEPELLMSLAFAHAHVPPLDLAQAEAFAREALALQPEWKYVKGVLLPSIQKGLDGR